MLKFQTKQEWAKTEIQSMDPETMRFWVENSFPSNSGESLVLPAAVPAAVEEEEPMVISEDLGIVAIDPNLEKGGT